MYIGIPKFLFPGTVVNHLASLGTHFNKTRNTRCEISRYQDCKTIALKAMPHCPVAPEGRRIHRWRSTSFYFPVTYLQNILGQTNTYIPTQANLAFSEKLKKFHMGRVISLHSWNGGPRCQRRQRSASSMERIHAQSFPTCLHADTKLSPREYFRGSQLWWRGLDTCQWICKKRKEHELVCYTN